MSGLYLKSHQRGACRIASYSNRKQQKSLAKAGLFSYVPQE